MIPNNELQDVFDNNDIWKSSFNDDVLNYFPEETFALFSLSFDPIGYYDILETQDDFDQFASEFKRETGMEMKEVFESIDGSIVFSLFDFKINIFDRLHLSFIFGNFNHLARNINGSYIFHKGRMSYSR